jgi:hypothetical protein
MDDLFLNVRYLVVIPSHNSDGLRRRAFFFSKQAHVFGTPHVSPRKTTNFGGKSFRSFLG